VSSARGSLVVFCKAPRPGRVKTRLTPALSAEEAAALYEVLLDDVLRATADFARELGLVPVATVDPPDARAEIARVAPRGFVVVSQRGANLGRRMAWAAAEAAAAGRLPVLLRGSDSPALDRDLVADALAGLATADLVLSPDRDGGYNLVGLRRPAPGLFDHPMSTKSVLDDTLANARRLGLSAHLLPPSFDIDAVDDLARLAAARSPAVDRLCPRLLAWLDASDLWRRAPTAPAR